MNYLRLSDETCCTLVYDDYDYDDDLSSPTSNISQYDTVIMPAAPIEITQQIKLVTGSSIVESILIA